MADTKADGTSLVFALNGERIELKGDQVDPNMSLIEFIRSKTKFRGVKLGCGEGGCGACAVILSKIDPATKEPVTISVNSCLRPLASMDGWAITTTEGLGSVESKIGLHPVQDRMASMNATQCGFCTPGMVCTLYARLKGAEAQGGLTMQELEHTYDGNICRCTGYRPILDAAKTFAKDSDIEDLVCKTTKKGDYDHSKYDPQFPAFLKTHQTASKCTFKGPANAANGPLTWARVPDLASAFEAMSQAKKDGDVKLIWANTGSGIFKNDKPSVMIDISGIAALTTLEVTKTGLTVGAGYSLTALLNLCKMLAAEDVEKKTNNAPWAEAFHNHILKIANTHVRNVGSIGGNLVMARCRGFQSDLSTLMLGVGASVTVAESASASKVQTKTQSFEEFLSFGPKFNGILVSVSIPFHSGGGRPVFRSYKTSIRPDNSHALLNGAFSVRLSSDSTTVEAVTLAYGGVAYGKPGDIAVRATKTEAVLKGQLINENTLQTAMKVLSNEFKIDGERAEYRQRMVASLFYKFFVNLLKGKTTPHVASAAAVFVPRPVVQAKQHFKFDEKEHAPVSKPIPKIEGGLQCSGEAQFVDDTPTQMNTLFAAVCGVNQGRGVLKSFDTKAAMAAEGVVAFVSAADIPGENSGSIFRENHPVFLPIDGQVGHYGQPFGLVIADSKCHAERAAALVTHVIETKESEKPITTLQDAIDNKSMFEAQKDFKTGDFAALKSAHSAKGKVTMGSQQHFYMETQTSYAWLDEENATVVQTATQWADGAHQTVARVLGVPLHRVKIVHRRSGGGFGGKLTHAAHVSCMTAVAARKVKRPVRLYLPRQVDMQICGGREECQAEYEVKYDDNGKIEGFKMDVYRNAGFTQDFSFFGLMAMLGATNQVYHIPHYDVHGQLAKSNLPTRTVVRGPGEIEASYVMETVIEQIAHNLNKPAHQIREANFYDLEKLPAEKQIVPNGKKLTHYTIPQMWQRLKGDAKFDDRYAAVQKFNAENRFTKRGLSITPVRYEVSVWNRSALVNIYGDGSVVISHSGTEMGQGINTKAAQVASHSLGKLLGVEVPLSLIRFDDLRSDTIANASFTGGSTGSEATCECIRRCAETLVKRMQPIVEKLQKEREEKIKKGEKPDELKWEAVCGTAKQSACNLSAQSDWSGHSPDSSLSYHNYGCAVSEVELDVLTGDVKVLATDLMYDAGKSLNPAIDIGQCEGAFMMGLGYYLREEVTYLKSGALYNQNTWEYKPPLASDVPRQFNVHLLQDQKFDKGILSSKCSGEPPLVLATSVAMAVRHAIHSARRDAGRTDFVPIHVPATLDIIQNACAVTTDALSLAAKTAK